MDNMDFALISNLKEDRYMTIWQDLNKLVDNMVLIGMDRDEAINEVFEALQDI